MPADRQDQIQCKMFGNNFFLGVKDINVLLYPISVKYVSLQNKSQ
jgi:hypothetical protein